MNLAKIRAKAKKAIENLYEDTCDILIVLVHFLLYKQANIVLTLNEIL